MTYPQRSCEPLPYRLGLKAGRIAGLVRRAPDLVPSDCPLCHGRAAGGRLCIPCADDVIRTHGARVHRCAVCALALVPSRPCPDCSTLQPAFERVIAAFDYVHPGDLLIQQFKTGRRFQHARFLAGLLATSVRTASPALSADTILVPVPSSRSALRQRGFNPAREIARYTARHLRLACRYDLLLRDHDGHSQKLLSRIERREHVRQLYRCTGRADGASIAVVDDVLTTGNTLHSIACSLKEAGASSVVGLVLARTPYHQRL